MDKYLSKIQQDILFSEQKQKRNIEFVIVDHLNECQWISIWVQNFVLFSTTVNENRVNLLNFRPSLVAHARIQRTYCYVLSGACLGQYKWHTFLICCCCLLSSSSSYHFWLKMVLHKTVFVVVVVSECVSYVHHRHSLRLHLRLCVTNG